MSVSQQTATNAPGGLAGGSSPLTISRLKVGVDNHRYDVFLSPRWQAEARRFLFEQILHHAQPYLQDLFPSQQRRRSAATTEFRASTALVLQEALNQAKEANNIEIKLLARLSLIKWLRAEMQAQFSRLASLSKEEASKRATVAVPGKALVLQSKIADYQSNRRYVLRAVAENIFQVLEELEEASLRPARAALLGSVFSDAYEVVRNRLVFLENPSDSFVLMEYYVMLGYFTRDEDREDIVGGVMSKLLETSGPALPEGEALALSEQERQTRAEQLQEMDNRIAELSGQGDGGSGGLGWLGRLSGRKTSEPAEPVSEETLEEFRQRRKKLAEELKDLESKTALLRQSYQASLLALLRQPETAAELFGALSTTGAPLPRTPAQDALLQQLHSELERAGLLKFILASYHLKPIYRQFCPPLNPQQLKYAVVDREGWKRLEELLDQFPTQDLPIEKLEDMAKRVRRLRRPESEALLVRFVRDFARLRRDTYHRECLLDLMERIHLVVDEKTRNVSRLNRSLHEFVLSDERSAGEEHVLTHVVIKADVRDSTGITDELLRRGLNPATHFSFNFYEPVHKLMARYAASKIFIEGDALILGLYETEADRGFQRAVAKACLLSKQIIEVCQVYNDRARTLNLPILELGLGIAFQASPPHYWEDGDTRIMISKALNKSDRLAGCTRMARKLVPVGKTPFRVFQFQGYPTLTVGEQDEEEELLLSFNVMGVCLNEEGFHKLQQEISLSQVEVDDERLRPHVTALHCGTVPLGSTFEKLVIREARVPRVRLPGGNVEKLTERVYYEVCVEPEIYQKFRDPRMKN